jgi:uncharacterized protein involved in type VI secretion and phage assembly
MTVSLKHADGSYTPWHGYVKQSAQLGSDGGLARYQLTTGSWLEMIADAQAERAHLGPIRFAAQHPTAFQSGLEDPVTSFMAQRRLKPNAVALGSWDYRQLPAL